jgi:hypothetical protein
MKKQVLNSIILLWLLILTNESAVAQFQVTLELDQIVLEQIDEGPWDNLEELFGWMAVFGYRMEDSDGKIKMKNSFENSSLSPRRLKNLDKPGEITKFLWESKISSKDAFALKQGERFNIGESLTFRNLTLSQVRSLKIRLGGNLLDFDFGLLPSFMYRHYDCPRCENEFAYPSILINLNDFKDQYATMRRGQSAYIRFPNRGNFLEMHWQEANSRVVFRYRLKVEYLL